MFGGLFKGLRSNKPINTAHTPSLHVQEQMKALQRIQKLNQQNARKIDSMPDFDARNREMLRRQQEMMRR